MTSELRRQKAACLRENGYTIPKVAEALGVSVGRARQLIASGKASAEPDEIIFAPLLKPETLVHCLPVSRITRDALLELGVLTFGDLLTGDLTEIGRSLLRFPNIGRGKLEEVEQMLGEWLGRNS